IGPSYAAPAAGYWFGTDIFERSVALKVIKGAEVAMTIGFVSSVLATMIGLTLGALAGYFGNKVDEIIVWFYTTVSSVPWILLMLGIAFVLGRGIHSVVIAL